MALVSHVPTGYDALTGEVKAWDYTQMLNTEILKPMKILVATEKPFAKKAVDGIREIVEGAGHQLALLEKYTDKAQLLEAVADADALIVRSDKVTAEVIDAAKVLKIVVRAGAGYDNVDLAAATARGIVVMNTPGQNSNAVAELALAMMIFMSRNRFTPGTVRSSWARRSASTPTAMWAGSWAARARRWAWRSWPTTPSSPIRRSSRPTACGRSIRSRSSTSAPTSSRCTSPPRRRPRARSVTTS